jgi:uncharacterized protein (DUF1697 family)
VKANRYVAFLRAVNVGGRVVKMPVLKRTFEGAGFRDVATFIASGNVIFSSGSAESAALEAKIERALQQALGFEVATFVRSLDEVAAAAAHTPFGSAAGEQDTVYVAFLRAQPAVAHRQAVMKLQGEHDRFHVNGRELYWLCRVRFSETKISGALLEKTLQMPATLRNTTTVRRLAAKYCGA